MPTECIICKNNKPFAMPYDIVNAVINGDLVLFCGAGISTEGKTVLPNSLYSLIKDELSIDDNDIPFSNLMQLYCGTPNGRKKLLQRIRERFQYIHSFPELERQATAFHRELSEIYSIKTIITTNWDTYFEDYCSAVPITIPEDVVFWDDTSRCVLKIHGSIDNLSSIVATTDDYKKCFSSLQNGAIGSFLKSILATKTVVFIGFSFGDEDFNQIINYLKQEMGDIYPHIYIVTLDESLEKRLNYSNSSVIISSGTFFLHRLKEILIDKGFIVNHLSLPIISEVLDELENLHQKIASIDLEKYPSAVYTLAYQDGVIHAFERFIQNYQTGEYNCPNAVKRLVNNYNKIMQNYHQKGDYWDSAYYEGYKNGLILIDVCSYNPESIASFPYIYLPNAKRPINSFAVYEEELIRVSNNKSKFHRYAKSITKDCVNNGLVVHHPPYQVLHS